MKEDSNETQKKIIQAAIALFSKHGLLGLGLTEVMNAAGVPKGSFYHYFASKHEFQARLIEIYTRDFVEDACKLLNNKNLSAYDRLSRFWNLWHKMQEGSSSGQICPFVRVSLEADELSNDALEAVRVAEDRLLHELAASITDGRNDGSLGVGQEPTKQAETLYYLWIGASVSDGKARNGAPLRLATEQTSILLNPVARTAVA